MKQLTQEESKKAHKYWLLRNKIQEAETLQNHLKWARNGLFLSAETVAKKFKISRAAYSKYEEYEEKAEAIATL